jgi:putative serine protease PepD
MTENVTTPQPYHPQPAPIWPEPGQAGYRAVLTPPAEQEPQPALPTARPGRFARGFVTVVAAAALSVSSGLAGAYTMHRIEGASQSTTVNHAAAPVVDRSSLAGVIAAVQPSVVSINTGTAEGSGVIVSADGAILTNNHVVATARGNTVQVTFSTGRTAQATIVGTDPGSDLAVIKAQGVTDLTAAKFGNSDDIQQGDTVIALGSPLGLSGSASEGIVSALHRTISVGDDQTQRASARGTSIADAIQTDAAINPGNSGGPLVNLAGHVIGINTAIATSGQSQGNIGVGFAIPSNRAKQVAEQLLKGQKVSHPFLGVQVGDSTSGTGAVISDVVAGGPADKAGLVRGDIVTKVGDKEIKGADDLVAAIQAGKPGDKLTLTVIRNGGAPQQITVTLGEAS